VVLYTGGGGTPDGGGTAYHALTLLSTPQHPCYPLPLAEGHQAGVLHPAGTKFMALNQSLRCHNLKQQGETSACFVRQPQSGVDVGRAHPILCLASCAIIHRQHRQDRPLIRSAEGPAVGERGEHGSFV